ncbi:Zn-dependent peptidase ImmA (M78 family) [Sinorhizobium fredii]|uniref:ImmA/IrrE family metallo-endopeptidase n=1 Tax=Rhizobium fredii TaxID=380 RepID=UPI00351584C2
MTLNELRKSVFRRPDYPAARAAAQNALNKFGITRPPVDPEAIAEAMGINVLYVDFEPEVSREISGLYDFQSKTIYINKDIPSNRKTFTIAHELGHALLHEQYVKSQNYQAMPRSNYHFDKPAEEVEADVFAACLLVPKNMLKSYKSFADIGELGEIFAVSPDVVVHQMKFA